MIIDKNGKIVANTTKPLKLFDNEAAKSAWLDTLPTEEGFGPNNFNVIIKNHLTAGAEVYWKLPNGGDDKPNTWLASDFTDIKAGDLIFHKNPSNNTFGTFVIEEILSNGKLKGRDYYYTINSIKNKGLKLFTGFTPKTTTIEYQKPITVSGGMVTAHPTGKFEYISSIETTELSDTDQGSLYFINPKIDQINY